MRRRRRAAGAIAALTTVLVLSFAGAALGSTNAPGWWIDHGLRTIPQGVGSGAGQVVSYPTPLTPGIEPFWVHLGMSDANSGIAPPGVQFRMLTWVPAIYGNWTHDDADNVYLWVDRFGHTTDGMYSLDYRASDWAGTTSIASVPIKIDTRPPTTDGASGWVNGLQPYVLTAVDQVPGSGVAATIYRVDQSTPWVASVASSIAPTFSTNVALTPSGVTPVQGSVHTIDFGSVDAALPFDYDGTATHADGSAVWPGPSYQYGNVEGTGWTFVHSVSSGWFVERLLGYQTRTVQLDVTAPTVTVTGNDDAWHNAPVTLAFSATDRGAGVAYIEWSSNGGAAWTRGDSAIVGGNGAITVQYRAVDKVGLVPAAQSVTVKVATTPPSVACGKTVIVKRNAKAAVPFNVTAVTPTALVDMAIKNANGQTVMSKQYNAQPTGVWTSTPAFRVSLAKGTYRIVFGAIDEAGNTQSTTGMGTLKVK